MQETQKVRIASRILRSPQVFQAYGELAEGIARDVVIYIALRNSTLVTLRVSEFAELFGYNRSHLNKKKELTPEQVKGLKLAGFREDDYNTALGYALCKLTGHNLIFPDCWKNDTRSRYKSLQVLKQLDTFKSQRGTVYALTVNPELLELNRKEYQTIDLNEYKALLTPKGQHWDAARRMYLHLVWKRQIWDKTRKAPGVRPSVSRYDELLVVAGLDYGSKTQREDVKRQAVLKNASALRKVIESVSGASVVSMRGHVDKCPHSGEYSVRFERYNQAA